MQIKSTDITMVNVAELIPYAKNMNKHTPEQIDRLVKLIEYQGWRDPIIVQRGTNVIAAGNGRYEAAIKMGAEKIPVIYQEFENEAQFYAFVVSHNAINASSWGGGLDLSKINNELQELGPEFDIDFLALKDFTIEPLEKFEMEDELREDMNRKFILEITFPNDMEMRDIHDDLVSRGYIVKEKTK